MARRPQPGSRLPSRLTAIQKRVLYLRLEWKLSFSEIGKKLGIKKSAAYQHYLYAVEKARRMKGAPHERSTSTRR